MKVAIVGREKQQTSRRNGGSGAADGTDVLLFFRQPFIDAERLRTPLILGQVESWALFREDDFRG